MKISPMINGEVVLSVLGTLNIDNEMGRRRRAEVKFSRARVLRMCDVVNSSTTKSQQIFVLVKT